MSVQGICAICGERASIDGYTRDYRVILTCGDAVDPSKVSPWSRGARLHGDCRRAYASDRAHGLVYPAEERRSAILEQLCLYCRRPLRS